MARIIRGSSAPRRCPIEPTLNEHVIGTRWPPPEIRLDRLREAIEVIRRLWPGDVVDHWGAH